MKTMILLLNQFLSQSKHHHSGKSCSIRKKYLPIVFGHNLDNPVNVGSGSLQNDDDDDSAAAAAVLAHHHEGTVSNSKQSDESSSSTT